MGAERNPELRAGKPSARTCERGRRDADHLVSLAGDRHDSADDAGIGREGSPPERVAQHHHARGAVIVGRLNRASARGAHAERREVRAADGLAHQHLCRGRQSHAPNERRRRGHVGERCLRRSQIVEVRRRHRACEQPSAVGRCDDGDPTGLSDAEAAQKDRVDDGIHRRRDRDADREREDREDSEERCGPEPPQGKPDVVDHAG